MPLERVGPSSEELLRLTDQIARGADVRAATGIRIMRVCLRQNPVEHLVRTAARVLEPLGFVAVCAEEHVPARRREELCHRHVVLFASGETPQVTQWIHDLASASPRAHLVVFIARTNDWRLAPGASPRPCREGSRRHVERADWLIQRGELRHAESLLLAIVAEAAARGAAVDASVQRARAEVYFWQGRFEAARTALRGLAEDDRPELLAWRALVEWAAEGDADALTRAARHLPPQSAFARLTTAERWLYAGCPHRARRVLGARRPASPPLLRAVEQWVEARCSGSRSIQADRFIKNTGAHGILRWGMGRQDMNLLHGVTTLLQVVQDAEDEFHALQNGCAWIRREIGAEAAGVTASDGTLVVADRLTRADLDVADVRDSIRTGCGRAVAAGAQALITAPVRYGGATIGMAVVRGPAQAATTFADAAAAFACACAPALRARLDALACAGAGESSMPQILGRSPGIVALRAAIARAAGTLFPVLVEGESGTGKELVARALHRLSARRDRRFSALNCAAISDELVEAELFGHARGAFTGALNARAGLFEEAHGGTLFLDEVSELSPRAQAKLLRVLQEREIRRVGEHAPRPVDVRVIAATNVPLAEAAARGTFRQDLLFRLAVVRIRVSPLRDRIEDVPLLAQACWRSLIADAQKRALLGPDAVAALCRHRWPGNVRELQNAVAALVVAAPSRGRVTARHVAQVLAVHGVEPEAAGPLDAARQAFERRMVAAALARHGGRQVRAARELGLSRQGLAKAIKRLGLGYHRPGAEVRAAPHPDDRPGAAGRRDARLFAHSSGAR